MTNPPHARAPHAAPTRRDFVGGMTLLALALGVPAAAVRLDALSSEDLPTEAQRALFRDVSQLVLPRTLTAGAGDAGVGDFVLLALAHGLDGSRWSVQAPAMPIVAPRFLRNDGSLRHAEWLEHMLDSRAHGRFLALDAAQRAGLLAQLDAEAFAAPTGPQSPWRTIKDLVLTGYYTSQVGGARELRYQLVPGRFDADVSLHPGDRAWSSDWTAVDFG